MAKIWRCGWFWYNSERLSKLLYCFQFDDRSESMLNEFVSKFEQQFWMYCYWGRYYYICKSHTLYSQPITLSVNEIISTFIPPNSNLKRLKRLETANDKMSLFQKEENFPTEFSLLMSCECTSNLAFGCLYECTFPYEFWIISTNSEVEDDSEIVILIFILHILNSEMRWSMLKQSFEFNLSVLC